MKHIILFSMLIIAGLISCQKKSTVSENGSAVYACPMKCEGDKVYAEPGKCPVCGMDLKPVEGSMPSISYNMQITTAPDQPGAGQPVTLAFTPGKSGDTLSQVPLDEVHEKKIHVIVVSSDLSWYSHIHPEYQADGSYTVTETFPAGGEYIVFADYQPTGGSNQVERKTITVSGTPKVAESFTQESLETEVEGYKVRLNPLGGKFLTNNVNHIGVDITQDEKPVTDLENVMGAKGHLVIISGDGQKYLHVHPEEVDGKLDMHTSFDQPGFYRAFFQFQTKGTLHTSYFTLDVKEGKPGDIENPTGHSHDHGDGEHSHGNETHTH